MRLLITQGPQFRGSCSRNICPSTRRRRLPPSSGVRSRVGTSGLVEAVARDLPQVSLDDALRLVHLCGEKQSPKYERAALRWLEGYRSESSPSLREFAKVTRELE